jgi:hypothetical protein
MAKTVTDTGWAPIIADAGNNDTAVGHVEMTRGSEPHPCFCCRHWERDQQRIMQHFYAAGLVMCPDGRFETPIAKDIPGRKSLRINPASFGWCNHECRATQDEASCEDWTPVKTASELQARLYGRVR